MTHIIVIRDNGGDRIIGFLGLIPQEFVTSVVQCSTVTGTAVFRGMTESKSDFITRAKTEFAVTALPGVTEKE